MRYEMPNANMRRRRASGQIPEEKPCVVMLRVTFYMCTYKTKLDFLQRRSLLPLLFFLVVEDVMDPKGGGGKKQKLFKYSEKYSKYLLLMLF
jgi:hypothetical protein